MRKERRGPEWRGLRESHLTLDLEKLNPVFPTKNNLQNIKKKKDNAVLSVKIVIMFIKENFL